MITVSEQSHAELYWRLRGRGGNFGVVTAFHFRLQPHRPAAVAGIVLHPRARRRPAAGLPRLPAALLRAYRDFMRDAPDEVGGAFALITAPPEPFVPEPLRGRPATGLILSHAGPVEDGEAALRPLRELGGLDLVQPMPYTALQQLLDPSAPRGMQNYWTGDLLAELPDEAVDVLLTPAAGAPSLISQVVLVPGGGAIARIPQDAMAIGERKAAWNIHYLAMWPDPADGDRNVAWTQNAATAMKPWTTGGPYLNFTGDEDEQRIRAAFRPRKYARLTALKDHRDPDNLFRLNQNIRPSLREAA